MKTRRIILDGLRVQASIGMLDTEVLVPGHGPLWRGSIRSAVRCGATVRWARPGPVRLPWAGEARRGW